MKSARAFAAAACSGLLAVAGMHLVDAHAQQIYKIVGPDGRVTFSDKAPLDPTTKAQAANVVSMQAGGGFGALPFELRQAASRYPVTLYTAANCEPCMSGRNLLANRGIPFTEKTVATSDDQEALKRMAGQVGLPFLTIGGQQIKGYSDTEWGQFLDAAGYPKVSQLPAGYQQVPASPLVAIGTPAAPTQAAAGRAGPTSAERLAVPSAQQAGENPAGIRF